MSLFLATLLPGLFLALLGTLLLINSPAISSTAKAIPRSKRAAAIFFGLATVWFVWRVSQLSESDLIFAKTPTPLMIGFGALALLSFIYTPEFLAVRGLSVLMLLAAEPLLSAAYMEYHHPQRLLMVTAVYLGISLAIYLGAAPYRLRDIFEWLFGQASRPRLVGGILLTYGLATAAVAFTY